MQQILVNPIAAMAQGQEAAGQMSDMRRQNALRQLYEQQGAGIAQGDQNALAALARIDPMAAAELTQKRNALDIDRQNLDLRKDEFGLRQKSADFDEARLDMARKEAKRAAAEHVAKMSAVERQQEIDKITNGLKGAIRFYEAGDEQGYNQYIQSLGVSPEEAPFEQFPAVAAQYDGVLGALKEVQELGAGPAPLSPEGKLAADVRSGLVDPSATTKDSAAEQKVSRLMELGFDRDTAIAMADGLIKVQRDPRTEEVYAFDLRTNKPWAGNAPTETTRSRPAAPPAPSDDTIPAASDAFGIEGAFKGAVNSGMDMVGADPLWPDVQRAQDDFAVLQESLLGDIASGYDRQPPSWLLQNIRGLTPEAGSPTTGASRAKSKLQALERSLKSEHSAVSRDLANRSLSPNEREKLEGRMSALNMALSRVDRAKRSFESSDEKTTSSGVKWKVKK